MKTLLLFLTAAVVFATVAFGGPTSEAEGVKILQKTPTFSKEEMNQMLFSASFAGGGYALGTIKLALYNPCRDKSIRGVVINIHGKDASSGQEQSIDLFIDLRCGPLQCAEDQASFTALAEAEKVSCDHSEGSALRSFRSLTGRR